jgi:murein DD-endopeptidase MepM/ murein hydrolase activator NlpD
MPPVCLHAPRPPGRGWKPLVLVLVATAGAFMAGAAPAAVAGRPGPMSIPPPIPPPVRAPDSSRAPTLWMPIAGAVVRGFDARAGPYGRGHRGIDIAAPEGELVRAPAAGRVVFAGPVAGTTWVTLLVAPGVLVTLGPLLDPAPTGGRVRARSPIGRVGSGHPATPTEATRQPGTATRHPGTAAGHPGTVTLHLGVRVDGVYVDPLAYLVDRPRARLAPLLSPGGLPVAGDGRRG